MFCCIVAILSEHQFAQDSRSRFCPSFVLVSKAPIGPCAFSSCASSFGGKSQIFRCTPRPLLVSAQTKGSSSSIKLPSCLTGESVRQHSSSRFFHRKLQKPCSFPAPWCEDRHVVPPLAAPRLPLLRSSAQPVFSHLSCHCVSVWFLSTFDAQCPQTDFAASQAVHDPATRSVVAPASCSSVPTAQPLARRR